MSFDLDLDVHVGRQKGELFDSDRGYPVGPIRSHMITFTTSRPHLALNT